MKVIPPTIFSNIVVGFMSQLAAVAITRFRKIALCLTIFEANSLVLLF